MIIIIDAYNLLYAISERKYRLTTAERNQFIKELGAYARLKKHTIILVFDGGDFDYPVKEKKCGIQIVYSGVNQSADSYIKKYILNNRSSGAVVVSSDREINAFVQEFSVASIDVRSFFVLVRGALQEVRAHNKKGVGDAVKTTVSTNEDVDSYMKEGIKNVPRKAEDYGKKNSENESLKKVNKTDRALLKKLSKL